MKNKRLLVVLLGLVLMLAVVACGSKETGKKSDGKKTEETVQSEVEDDKADVEESEDADKEEDTEDNTQSETPDNTQSDSNQPAEPVVTKTTMYAKSNVNVRSGAGTSNAQIGSLTKGQEVVKVGEENGWSKIEFNGTVGYVNSNYLSAEKVEVNNSNTTKPNNGKPNSSNNNSSSGNTGASNNSGTSTPVHEHTWTEVTEDEIHYYAWRTICNVCKTDLTDMTVSDKTYHIVGVCGGSYAAYYIEVDFVTENVVKTPVVTGYKCECGATKNK